MGIGEVLFWIMARSEPGMLLLGVDEVDESVSRLKSDPALEVEKFGESLAILMRLEDSFERNESVLGSASLLSNVLGNSGRLVPRSRVVFPA